MQIHLTVNGQPRQAEVEPRLLLVDLLRDEFDLTGTKVGCDTGQCGSCVVLLDGVSVKSCALLAAQADGADITTVEGVAEAGHLNPLQSAFQTMHAVQCGFCTPGMIVSLSDLLKRNPDPTEGEVRLWLEGHLCRCTGYENVVRAVEAARHISHSPARILADTPLKQLYERQVGYLKARDVDALMDNNYAEHVILTTFGGVYTGREAVRQYYRDRVQALGDVDFLSTDKFVESDGAFYFEATVRSAEGVRKVYNGCVVRDGRITHHFEGVK